MQVFKNQNGRIAGVASSDVFSKRVKKSKHLLKKWNAWGIDKSILDELISNGTRWVVIHETEESKDYLASIKEFVEKGIEADFGHSKQIFLPLIYFNESNVN